jgi:hypothetical protein
VDVPALPVPDQPLRAAGRGGGVDADTFVLTLPMAHQQEALALFVYIGGLSAATGMVIVETIALSTMVCNDLVMPLLLRLPVLGLAARADLSGLLLQIRRWAIAAILGLGYLYFRVAGEAYALVSIGLISFAAVAQFAPVVIGALFWKGGTRDGALAGLAAGFVLWAYTLLLPSFAKSGWLPDGFIAHGLFGIELLRPQHLFGLTGLDEITHCLVWSLLANLGAYIGISLLRVPNLREARQATLFVGGAEAAGVPGWQGTRRCDRPAAAGRALPGPRTGRGGLWAPRPAARIEERRGTACRRAPGQLCRNPAGRRHRLGLGAGHGGVGGDRGTARHRRGDEHPRRGFAGARLHAGTGAEVAGTDARHDRTARGQRALARTGPHEGRLHFDRDPRTAHAADVDPRLFGNAAGRPEVDLEQRSRFLGIIVSETVRLSRLINQILDLAKLESGRAEWTVATVDVSEVIREAADSLTALYAEKQVVLDLAGCETGLIVMADRDRLMQVMVNLLSNALKFVPAEEGRVTVGARGVAGEVRVTVGDNGPGIEPADQEVIFEKFRQGSGPRPM